MQPLSHRQRIENCIAGAPIDRVPVALWRHFPVDDQTPGGLAAAVIDFQNRYDFDLVKITPASSFCLKDWGCRDVWRGNPYGTRDYTDHPVRVPEDWRKLPVLDPAKGYLGQQLECVQMIRNQLPASTPVIQTIFSPLAQAKNLVGGDKLLTHLRKYPDAVQAGLEIIAQTTILFIRQLYKMNIDGIFYALQHASYHLLNDVEYAVFGKPYDLQILAEAKGWWLNILHLHGDDVMFDAVVDYPVAVINWHDQETPPSLSQAQAQFKGVVCGGVRQWDRLALGSPEEVKQDALRAIRETGSKRFILGTGCVTPIITPHGNILALKESVTQMQ